MAKNKPGAGIDIGTAFMVAARDNSDSNLKISSVRDCFLTLPLEQAPMLEMSDISFVKGQNSLYVVGNDAVNLSGVLGGELRRPLSKGFISAKEEEGKAVVSLILEQILGKPLMDNEPVAFSIPGPVYDMNADFSSDQTELTFHSRFFKELLEGLGYKARPINEAMAITYSETLNPQDNALPLTALSISFGAGMTNVALTYKSLLVRSFSIPFGGDYIDAGAAKATDSPISHITMLKEHGVNVAGQSTNKTRIENPLDSHDSQSDRQADAIALMYRDLLTKLVESTNKFFSLPSNRTEIKETIPVIYSGGTSMVPGFSDLFKDVFMDNLSLRFKVEPEAKSAAYPMDATSRGALNFIRLVSGVK